MSEPQGQLEHEHLDANTSASESTGDNRLGSSIVRPTNALDPLGSTALSSLMRPDDPSTPERPRFPNFTQLQDRDSPVSALRMPSPYPTSPQSNKSTTPTSTPPRSPSAFGASVLEGHLERLDLESTTPTNSPPRLGAATDRVVTNEEQLDGPSEPRSPTMTATRLASNFGSFEHGFRTSPKLKMPTARQLDPSVDFQLITNPATLQDETPSPDETPIPPPNTPVDAPQPHQTIAFGTSTPGDRPSFRESHFFQRLDAQQQAHVIESSASGFHNLTGREMKLIAHDGVKIRDFAAEALAAKQKSETEAASPQYENPEEDIFPASEGPDIAAAVGGTLTAKNDGQMDDVSPKLTREQSYKNIYGSFAYEKMMKKKKWEEREESSSDDDDWNDLIMGGNMGYGS
ncbi:hypothetical protein EG328_008626 [Venturia inaequalis]|uniref:Uncharacterized protein n=1 Tax=Venturia inaequalis TaxID=5025 RepID=A0A8H3YMZ1_VENIN|nr:hypothetical protein EG328_008626 [Venturia inaequalis]KAE9974367.1 hypothetical protein EG327_008798 [Venturia inaequalis]RDI77965.1 hypothetical protein Vi05172_g12068 [Venturia inaequalis]